jgi:hypothetical protein
VLDTVLGSHVVLSVYTELSRHHPATRWHTDPFAPLLVHHPQLQSRVLVQPELVEVPLQLEPALANVLVGSQRMLVGAEPIEIAQQVGLGCFPQVFAIDHLVLVRVESKVSVVVVETSVEGRVFSEAEADIEESFT